MGIIHRILLGRGRILANNLRLSILVYSVHTVIRANLWWSTCSISGIYHKCNTDKLFAVTNISDCILGRTNRTYSTYWCAWGLWTPCSFYLVLLDRSFYKYLLRVQVRKYTRKRFSEPARHNLSPHLSLIRNAVRLSSPIISWMNQYA